jgi:hypothetical protein
MKEQQKKIDATDAPPEGAIEWLERNIPSIDEYVPREMMFVLIARLDNAKQIQKQMVMHAYNYGWDDGHWDVKGSEEENADENFYNEFYGKR